ncbi:MAG: hypothetical protein IJI60_03500 [Bacilli bacterium]|nr:hypothetical protein [Bacilli bacterium]
MAWTGLDIESVYEEIEKFNTSSFDAENHLREMYDHFFSNLQDNWSSPNAVQFTNKAIPNALAIYDDFTKERDRVIEGAKSAALTLATSHGATFDVNRIEVRHAPITMEYYAGCKETKTNPETGKELTGMEIEEVKTARDTLISESRTTTELIRELPTEISFYDGSSNLQTLYKTNINTFAKTIEELNNDLINGENGINQHINEETGEVETGITTAENVLTGTEMADGSSQEPWSPTLNTPKSAYDSQSPTHEWTHDDTRRLVLYGPGVRRVEASDILSMPEGVREFITTDGNIVMVTKGKNPDGHDTYMLGHAIVDLNDILRENLIIANNPLE